MLTDHQALELQTKRNRSNKTKSAWLTRWLDRIVHFSLNVSHITGKHLALTDYVSRNPFSPPQANDVYEEEYVIDNIVAHYKFVAKYGCLSNSVDQSENDASKTSQHKANKTPKQHKTREQTALDCLIALQYSRVKLNGNSEMNARTIENLEIADPSTETRNLIARWRDIVQPGIYRQSSN